MASIKGMLPSDVMVIRDGHQVEIPARDLVTGDIVQISLGNKLPADVRFIEVSSDLKLDRAVLTGESEPINGVVDSTDANFLETKNVGLQGTLCVSGSGMGESIAAILTKSVPRADCLQVSSYRQGTTRSLAASPSSPLPAGPGSPLSKRRFSASS
jgi:sodium/potassium-transporting ATPase subunit alpha